MSIDNGRLANRFIGQIVENHVNCLTVAKLRVIASEPLQPSYTPRPLVEWKRQGNPIRNFTVLLLLLTSLTQTSYIQRESVSKIVGATEDQEFKLLSNSLPAQLQSHTTNTLSTWFLGGWEKCLTLERIGLEIPEGSTVSIKRVYYHFGVDDEHRLIEAELISEDTKFRAYIYHSHRKPLLGIYVKGFM